MIFLYMYWLYTDEYMQSSYVCIYMYLYRLLEWVWNGEEEIYRDSQEADSS